MNLKNFNEFKTQCNNNLNQIWIRLKLNSTKTIWFESAQIIRRYLIWTDINKIPKRNSVGETLGNKLT